MGRETCLADLYRQSVQTLTQNRTEWMGLLSSVSKYYRMSFDKNVLIYVQRPDAGLLATKMGWEKQTGRYLKAGSKGIGVIDMNNPKATLAYYFDLADTRGDYEGFRKAMSAVWSLERQYQPEILDRFHKQFGTDGNSVENCLCQLAGMQAEAERIYIHDAVYHYILQLVRVTREHPYLEMGASPRATMALVKMSRAFAWLRGRDYVSPEDVSCQYAYVVIHRLQLNAKARMEQVKKEQVIAQLLQSVKKPTPKGVKE